MVDTLTRLKSQMSRGELVLFTGAGFSLDARNRMAQNLPSTSKLRTLLWELCFPNQPIDERSSLGELYELAMRQHHRGLEQLLEVHLSVDPESLPEYYRLYFSFPWHKIYTLNIDDLELAAARRWDFTRPLVSVTEDGEATRDASRDLSLNIVHLNGRLPGPLSSLTFSELQYAKRLTSSRDPFYALCVADLTARPTVFIGTELHEDTLWFHIEMRRRDSTRSRDLRPTSLLVCPDLTPTREALLSELRIEWVQGKARWFAEEYLPNLSKEANKGYQYISSQALHAGVTRVPLVSELVVSHPTLHTDYLVGAEPHWSDLLAERAIERTSDKELLSQAQQILEDEASLALAITGTAGTGKSSSLMRVALTFSNKGIPALWIDRDSEASPAMIKDRAWSIEGPLAIAIDDADLFGRQVLGMLSDLVPNRDNLLFVFAVRSAKYHQIEADVSRLGTFQLQEHTVPYLTDDDIDGLLDTLERHHRLGPLKGLNVERRRKEFARAAGRQLLVAMFNATSGENFEDKVIDEAEKLTSKERFIYALICTCSHLRHYLTREEILLACGGDSQQDQLKALDFLVRRNLVRAAPPLYRYRARHRVIAQLVFGHLQKSGQLRDCIEGLAFAIATKALPEAARTSRPWRLLIKLINHNFLVHTVTTHDARHIYSELENVLSFDHHYWLQRGSLEVEIGDLRLAQNFLEQARSLSSDNYRVETEFGYLRMRQAVEASTQPRARQLLEEGVDLLEGVIQSHGHETAYPFHILGTQGLEWLAKWRPSPEEERGFLRRLVHWLDRGLTHHALNPDLKQLRKDIERRRMMTVVVEEPDIDQA